MVVGGLIEWSLVADGLLMLTRQGGCYACTLHRSIRDNQE
jgi:hypothetical protein